MAGLEWYFDPLTPHQLTKKKKKNFVKVGPPLTKFSGSTHASALDFCSVCLEEREQLSQGGPLALESQTSINKLKAPSAYQRSSKCMKTSFDKLTTSAFCYFHFRVFLRII